MFGLEGVDLRAATLDAGLSIGLDASQGVLFQMHTEPASEDDGASMQNFVECFSLVDTDLDWSLPGIRLPVCLPPALRDSR